jgi:hypothetical protein
LEERANQPRQPAMPGQTHDTLDLVQDRAGYILKICHRSIHC